MPRRYLPVSLMPLAALMIGVAASAAGASEPGAEALEPPAASGAAFAPKDLEPAAGLPLAPEFAERLAPEPKLASDDRADRAALARFYARRGSAPLWTSATGVTEKAAAIQAEIATADAWGLEPSAFQLPQPPTGRPLSSVERAEVETRLSIAILKYARYARGGRAQPTALSPNLDRTLRPFDPARIMDEIAAAADPAEYLRRLHPAHRPFAALRQKYLELKGRAVVGASSMHATAGDGAERAGAHGAEEATIRRLLLNMEAWRWMPEDLGDFYVWVNVPEFTLRVVKRGEVIHTARVVVGKPDKQTPIFSEAVQQVIFHPYWGVPESIKINDILPSLARGSTRILERYNLRLQRGGRDIDPSTIDWSSVDVRSVHVYQPPGGANLLGVVKFRFPNKHDVYMHDTPDKHLFKASVRAFSHGCMRVSEAEKLAELLLAEDQGWPAARVAAAINGGPPNNQVTLQRSIPVHITYFTAAVDEEGKLTTFPDIYGHEPRIALGLAGKAQLIPRPIEDKAARTAEIIGALSDAGRVKKDWVKRAFGN